MSFFSSRCAIKMVINLGKKRIYFFCFSRTHQLCACIKIEITRQWFLINFHLKRPLLCFSHSLTIHVILWTNCWLITWLSGYHLSSSCVFHCSSFFFWCLKMKSSTKIHLFLYYFLPFLFVSCAFVMSHIETSSSEM